MSGLTSITLVMVKTFLPYNYEQTKNETPLTAPTSRRGRGTTRSLPSRSRSRQLPKIGDWETEDPDTAHQNWESGRWGPLVFRWTALWSTLLSTFSSCFSLQQKAEHCASAPINMLHTIQLRKITLGNMLMWRNSTSFASGVVYFIGDSTKCARLLETEQHGACAFPGTIMTRTAIDTELSQVIRRWTRTATGRREQATYRQYTCCVQSILAPMERACTRWEDGCHQS